MALLTVCVTVWRDTCWLSRFDHAQRFENIGAKVDAFRIWVLIRLTERKLQKKTKDSKNNTNESVAGYFCVFEKTTRIGFCDSHVYQL